MKDYRVIENCLQLHFCVNDEGRVALSYFGAAADKAPCKEREALEKRTEGEETFTEGMSPVEISLSGSGFKGHHGEKKIGGAASEKLRFVDFFDEREEEGRHILLLLESEELFVRVHYIFCGQLPVLRTYCEVKAKKKVRLEYVSSLHLPAVFPARGGKDYDEIKAFIPHYTWHVEAQWRESTLAELGLTGCHDDFTVKRIWRANTGSWSSKEFLPAGFLSDGKSVYHWQIEANGSWYAEIGNCKDRLYLALSGPTFSESAWALTLQAGETFETVKAAICLSDGIDGCAAAMTAYRRRYFAPYPADEGLPAQYNGYMHSNWDTPDAERLLKQIDVAAKLGLPYYVVDAGWFCKEYFWRTLGDWTNPQEPFEGTSLKGIFEYARSKGLKCGLWMEIEDVGVDCPCLSLLEPMLMKRGEYKVCDNERYFLDFSLEATREYMAKVLDFILNTYGVEYLKLDYNVDCPVGGDNNAESYGQGLLMHNRSYLQWLAEMRRLHPRLVLEGCASGGMRLDYATLYEYALGNISDQVHYNRVPYIVSNAAAYLVPEHTGVWAYPLADAGRKQIDMNFVNSAFFRVQYSGPCEKLGEAQLAAVKRGLEFGERMRRFAATASPFFPLGFCRFFDKTVAFGYRKGKEAYLAVYNLGGEKRKEIPCPFGITAAKIAFPLDGGAECKASQNVLSVVFAEEEDACIVELKG